MLLNRALSSIAVGLLILLAGSTAFGQGLEGMQLFAPAEVSAFGKGPQPNEGFFFAYDILYWSISVPELVQIGNPNVNPNLRYLVGYDPVTNPNLVINQQNEANTGPLKANFTVGNRIELGRITDNHGWLLSMYQLQDLSQQFIQSNVSMVFDEAEFGPGAIHLLDGNVSQTGTDIEALPLTFDTLLVQDNVAHWSVELNYLARTHQLHHGGFFEWFVGPRYLEFDDTFVVIGTGGILDASFWNTKAQNHVIGGQIGARYFNKRGRWTFSSEGRFLAGLNCQNISQIGRLGSQLSPPGGTGAPLVMGPTNISNTAYIRQWTPGVELRVDFRYQITRSVSFHAGWTGLFLDNMARAANVIDYTLDPNLDHYMGILTDQNRQAVFVHGVTVGIDVNR